MNKKTTYGSILKWNNTIAKWRATDDIHEAMDFARINYLEKKIAFVVKQIIDGMNNITKKYFVLDENKQVKYFGEPGKQEPSMNGDFTREDYEKEKQNFLSTKVEVKL